MSFRRLLVEEFESGVDAEVNFRFFVGVFGRGVSFFSTKNFYCELEVLSPNMVVLTASISFSSDDAGLRPRRVAFVPDLIRSINAKISWSVPL